MEYSLDEKALIFLSSFNFMTSSKFAKVLENLNSPSDIFTLSHKELFKLKDELKTNYEILIDGLTKYNEKEFFEPLNKRGIYCLTIISQNYPKKLLNLKNPPYFLYYVGNIDLINSPSVAIVGSRMVSGYGRIITTRFSKELAKSGLTIISGLADGVDKISHEGALEVGGNTIAVMGGGFNHIFQISNIELAREIGKKGLILTEYYLDVEPSRYTFPTRNRIIAGLSDAVLITEARAKSGSSYTKEYADSLGINVYCVPGNITSEFSGGTNYWIKNNEAICVLSSSDILKDLGYNVEYSFGKDKKRKGIQQTFNLLKMDLSKEEKLICDFLKNEEQSFAYLQEKTGFSSQTLNTYLTTLEINGIIKRLAGNTYIFAE